MPFFVNQDLTRADGIIQCRKLTTTEALTAGWRIVRLIRLWLEFPIPF